MIKKYVRIFCQNRNEIECCIRGFFLSIMNNKNNDRYLYSIAHDFCSTKLQKNNFIFTGQQHFQIMLKYKMRF